MPELPDLEAYLHALEPRVVGRTLKRLRIANPFLVRSVDPPVSAIEGRELREVRRLGKRIVFAFEDGLFLLLHLMIAGRLHWKAASAGIDDEGGPFHHQPAGQFSLPVGFDGRKDRTERSRVSRSS